MDRKSAQQDYDRLALAASGVPRFEFAGFFVGKVVKVVDGDTLNIALNFPRIGGMEPRVAQYPVRMLLYDSPEKGGKGVTREEREYELEVRAALIRLVLGKMVAVYVPGANEEKSFTYIAPVKKRDPYRRILGHLFVASGPTASQAGGCCSWLTRRFRRAPAAAEHRPIHPEDMPRPRGVATPEMTEEKGSFTVTIRGRKVIVPSTSSVPRGVRRLRDVATAGFARPGFIHVNQWMLRNARVKPCGGRRDGYSEAELASGVDYDG